MTQNALLAQYYVLGTLERTEHDAVTRRIERPANDDDRELAKAVAAFRDAMHDLDRSTEPLALPDGAWQRLDAALQGTSSGVQDSNVVTLPVDPNRQDRLLRVWRRVAIGAIAASVALAALQVWQFATPTPPLVMAILLDENGRSVALVEAFADDSLRVTPLAPIGPDGSQVLQVWTKPDPEGPPVSLGILERAIRAQVRGPDLPQPDIDQLYEITLEPAGGSPTGLPTGPIVGKGLAQPTY